MRSTKKNEPFGADPFVGNLEEPQKDPQDLPPRRESPRRKFSNLALPKKGVPLKGRKRAQTPPQDKEKQDLHEFLTNRDRNHAEYTKAAYFRDAMAILTSREH